LEKGLTKETRAHALTGGAVVDRRLAGRGQGRTNEAWGVKRGFARKVSRILQQGIESSGKHKTAAAAPRAGGTLQCPKGSRSTGHYPEKSR